MERKMTILESPEVFENALSGLRNENEAGEETKE
jgi:hypothetical protein